MKIQKYLDHFKKNRHIIISLIIAIAIIVLIYLKISSKLNTINNIKNIPTFSIPENAKFILEKYNLSIRELSRKKLVMYDPQNNCLIFIYPTSLESIASSIKSEYNTSIMEKDTPDRYIYIGKTINPRGITIYKLLVYFKDSGISYVTICGLQKLNETYLPAADELLMAYKEIFS